MPETSKRMDIDASTLSFEEWYFVWTVMGTRPDATMKDVQEFSVRTLGKSKAEQKVIVGVGLDSLMRRGFISYELDAMGNPKLNAQQEPIYKINGSIVGRVREYKSKV